MIPVCFTDGKTTIILSPNPVSDELTITLPENSGYEYFEIYNSLGQIVFTGNILKKTVVNTKNFLAGMYTIKFSNGASFEFKKIIKE